MRKILILIVFSALFVFSCKKERVKEVIVNPKTGQETIIKVNRFEDVLFDQNQKDLKTHLKANFENYKPVFNTTLDNEEYFEMVKQFATDPNMISAYKKVKEVYPNLNWVSEEITTAFSILIKDYSDIQIPKLYSIMFGPADFSYSYSKRVLARKDFITFSIDLYSINYLQNNIYYQQFPKYIMLMLDSAYLVPDIMNQYLRSYNQDMPLMELSPEASLIDIIVERGKYYYALTKLLPNSSLNSLFRYTKEQMQWVEENEYNIWGLIIQNGLLYSKDRPKYMHFITEGPSTKGLKNSPSRLGDYIGYKIVEKYMKNNNKTLKEMFEMQDAKEILNKSEYKPKKQK